MFSLAIIPGSKGKPNFAKLSRQDTGTHFMDSGGATGRHWQSKLPPSEPYFRVSRYTPKWKGNDGKERCEVSPYIPLHTFLDAILEIDTKLTKALRKAEKAQGHRFNYCDAADWLSEYTGKKAHSGDYSYNWENDLTQDFQFTPISDKDDWYYDDDALFTVETHNGADARGGFSDVVVCRLKSKYDGGTTLLEPQAGIAIISGTDKDGNELTDDAMRKLDQEWEVGYSNYPMSLFDKAISKVHTKNGQHEEIEVTLITGERVRVYISSRYQYL